MKNNLNLCKTWGSTSGFGEDLGPVEYQDVLLVK